MEYRDYEAILAKLHKVDPADMPAFYARLRQLRNSGIPRVNNPGKGQRRLYSRLDLWETHLAITLIEYGLPPHRVALLFDRWIRPHNAFQAVQDSADDLLMVIESYLNIAKGADLDDIKHSVALRTVEGFAEHMRRLTRVRVQIVLNVSKLTSEV